MTEPEIQTVLKSVKAVSNKINESAGKADLDSFLSCFANDPSFLAFSPDGVMRNYEEFKKVVKEYYTALQEQKATTLREQFNVIDSDLVVLGWTGNIIAQFKNGDKMIMNNYSITFVFKRMGEQWKVIHSHESALPSEVIKK